ncbi:MAG: M28 family peptidase [Planctomycetaceae bacterium]|nr:M28 family peptidase [Planctomycetaceae bacterium]
MEWSRCYFVAAALCVASGQANAAEPTTLDSNRTFTYLERVCEIGPRISGTEGMRQQQQLIEDHFAQFPCQVTNQEFDVAHPETGEPVRMKNIIVSWHPEAKQRLLLCCHYDTRPHPDKELNPFNRNKPFIGANDGGSGVALFMELAHHMGNLRPGYGIDFVFFDGEELVYDSRDKYFLGSEHFSQQYVDHPPGHRYVAGVLVDMIGDKNLNIYQEGNSLRYAGDVTRSVWQVAKDLNEVAFIHRRKHSLSDDHLPLNKTAQIPTCDIIDFDYAYWHKRNDLPAACSGESITRVGRVVMAWLERYRVN